MNTIILGTAHLKSTSGKCSPDKRLFEYKYSREVILAIYSVLKDLNYKVYIDIPEDDLNLSLKEELKKRVTIVNSLQSKYKNCIYVSIHVNAAGADGNWHLATGWEVYTSKGNTKADKLATSLHNAAKNNLKNKKIRTDFLDGDPDKESNFYVLLHTNCPAVLTENFFMDNKKDVDYLLSDEGFHEIVRLHIEGIINYIKDN